MSAFYDQASLVVVPSGYKSGKIYAQKPLTTDGQLTFTRASTATRVNASGLIEEVASGVPRLDYTNSSCPKLLLEPQRTNSQTYSEDFTNAIYVKSQCTATANTTTAPDGTLSGDSLTENTANDIHRIQASNVSVVAGTSYTLSLYAKNNGRRFLFLNADIVFGARTTFDLQSGVISQTISGTAKIEALPNGWYRCSVTGTALITRTNAWFAQLNNAGVATDTVYTGDGTSGLFFWGAMLEAGTYGTSYVKTEAAAVTRLADEASKQGISSLLSASEYTLFWEGTHFPTGQFNTFMTIYNNANQNLSALFYRNNTNNEVRAAIFNNAVSLSLYMASGVTASNIKCALRVKAGAYAFYVNGSLVNSSTNALAPASTLDSVTLQYFNATQSFDQKTAQALFFKTGLTNAQLAELTTL
jgi:hypothetical protein